MADAVKKLVARISVEGAPQATSQLQDFARQGEQSLARVRTEGGRASAALGDLGRAANDNGGRMASFGQAFETAESKIKGTVRGLGDVRGAIELVAPGAEGAAAGVGRLAGAIGNLADVAGTLASVFLRNPLGLIAIGLSAAAVGFLTLRNRIDDTVKAEQAYQKALEATGPLLESQIDQTRRLAFEKAQAARDAAGQAIAAQEAENARAAAARGRLLQSLERLETAQSRNPTADFTADIDQLRSSIAELDLRIAQGVTRIAELGDRAAAASVSSQALRAQLAAIATELEGFDKKSATGIAAINADFERTKAILDAGLANELNLSADAYARLLDIASRRRDKGLGEAFENMAATAAAEAAEIQAALEIAIREYNELANARQRAGADMEGQIDAYYREAEATRAGALSLQFYRQELERTRVENEARKNARDAFGAEDVAAVEGQVARVLRAYDDLQTARAQATERTKSQTDSLADAVRGLGNSFDAAGKRSARALADMAVGLDKASLSAERLIQTFASDFASKIIQDRITGPLASGFGSILDTAFSSFFGGSSGGYFGSADYSSLGSAGLPFGGPRAEGGPVEPGKVYLVGEKRAELFVPETRGRIIPEVRAMSPGRGGGGGESGIRVVVNNNGTVMAPQQAQTTERRGDDGMREIVILIEDTVDGMVANGRLDPSMRKSYGVRRPVRRT